MSSKPPPSPDESVELLRVELLEERKGTAEGERVPDAADPSDATGPRREIVAPAPPRLLGISPRQFVAIATFLVLLALLAGYVTRN